MQQTRYIVAHTPEELALCDVLRLETQTPEHPWQFPVVSAVRNGECLGYYATHTYEEELIAGPLVLRPGRGAGIRFMRLGAMMDRVLREAGFAWCWFSVDPRHTRYVHHFERWGLHCAGPFYKNGLLWYKRIF